MENFKPIPFTGGYNNRIRPTLTSASGVVGIGIVGTMVIGSQSVLEIRDERLINCMLVNSAGHKYFIKRPGFKQATVPQAGSIGTAILVWTGQGTGDKVISAFGGTNSTIYDGVTGLTDITGKATGITETFISTTATLAISSTDNTGWWYDTGAGLTKIADGDFPGNASKVLAGTFAHMDGYAFIMTADGVIWNSDLNSIANWTATSFVSANAYPDKGVGVVRYKNTICAFGSESTQFFYNAGNATGSPLQRIDNATVKVGAISADAIGQISDVLFFVGSSPEGGLTLYQYDGSDQRISTPEMDKLFQTAGASNISVSTIRYYGRSIVLVKALQTTFAYCLEDKRWHEWASFGVLWYKCVGLSVGANSITYSISNTLTAGKVYEIDPNALVFTDDGNAFTATIQSPAMTNGNLTLTSWDELRVLCDREDGTSVLEVSATDNDYASFESYDSIDLTLVNPSAFRLGSSAKRSWRFTHSDNTPFRIEAFKVRASASTMGHRII